MPAVHDEAHDVRAENGAETLGPGHGECDADGDQAAAGAADGALGRGLPAASGSRCRRKAAHQDFSRRPAVRRVSGATVTARAIRALSATTATTRPITTAASTAVLTTVKPPGPVSEEPGDMPQQRGQREHTAPYR